MTRLGLVCIIYNASVIYYNLKVFCVCVVWNGTKEIKSKSHSAKPRVYWIFVTKLMVGGANFWFQNRSGDENCYC